MGLTPLLARAAARRLHVFLVEGDGAFVLRTAAEGACRTRGWVLALSPADADVLLACRPLPGLISDAADALFDQMPRPRARAEVWHERHLDAVLDQLHAAYLRPLRLDEPEHRARAHADDQTEQRALRSVPVAQHSGPEPAPGPSGPSGPDNAPGPVAHGHPSGRSGHGGAADDADSDAPPVALAEHQPAEDHHAQQGQDQARTDKEHAAHTLRGSVDGSDHATQTGDKAAGHHEDGLDPSGRTAQDERDVDSPGADGHDGHDGHEDHQHHGHEHNMTHGHDMNMTMDMNHGMDMDMQGPGGIELASGARDRDGLEMDRLHVRLGPVLARWPAGLAVWCTLAGDVVTQVDVVQPAFSWPQGAGGDLMTAVRLDAAVQLLGLAGAGSAAARVRAARDAVLGSGRRRAAVAELVDQVPHVVERTPLLRWSLRGLGVVSAPVALEHGWPGSWVGDVHTRLLRLLDPLAPLDGGLVEGAAVAEALPVLLAGLDVGAARLVVASLVAQTADRGAVARPAVG